MVEGAQSAVVYVSRKRGMMHLVYGTIFFGFVAMQEERQKGYFDEAGNYVENPEVDEDGEVDAWLQSDEGKNFYFCFSQKK